MCNALEQPSTPRNTSGLYTTLDGLGAGGITLGVRDRVAGLIEACRHLDNALCVGLGGGCVVDNGGVELAGGGWGSLLLSRFVPSDGLLLLIRLVVSSIGW